MSAEEAASSAPSTAATAAPAPQVDLWAQSSGVIAEAVILFLLTAILVYYFRNPRTTPHFVSALVVLTWFFGFTGVLLLPLDVSIAFSVEIPDQTMVTAWKVVYWTTFILTWTALPVSSEYCASGEFAPVTKLKASVRNFVRSKVLMAAAGIVGLIYLIFVQRVSLMSLTSLLMAAGNTYGLMLMIAMLGYGLVDVPRRLWRLSSYENSLRRVYFRAVDVDNDVYQAYFSLDDTLRSAQALEKRLSKNSSREEVRQTLRANLMTVISQAEGAMTEETKSLLTGSTRRSSVQSEDLSVKIDQDVTHQDVVDLHRRLKAALVFRERSEQLWQTLLADVEDLESLTQGSSPPALKPRATSPLPSLFSTVDGTFNVIVWKFKVLFMPYIWRCLAALCAGLSLLLVWSEVTMSSHLQMSPLGELLDELRDHSSTVQLLSLGVLSYMCVCTYTSLFQFKMFGKFQLQGPQQSDAVSLLVNCIYQSRLQFSIGYNFLLVLNRRSDTQHTALLQLMSRMDLIPLFGTSFNVYAPIFMFILCVITLLNWYTKILNMLGFEVYDEGRMGDPATEERIKEGQTLLRRARQKRERMMKKGEEVGRGMATKGPSAQSLAVADSSLRSEATRGKSRLGLR